MPPATRFLTTDTDGLPADPPPPPPPSGLHPIDTDVVVILASLLCAVVSLAGLALIARCGCPRRSPGGGGEAAQAPPDKGIEKKALRQLPKVSYHCGGGAAAVEEEAECPICLSEFEEGDQLRFLPQCGHGFHAGCVDAWLVSHSSCPSCRRVLVVVAPPSRSWGRRRADSIDAAEAAENAEPREVPS